MTARTSTQGGLVGIRPNPKGTRAPSRRRKREQPKEPSKQAEPAQVSGTSIIRRKLAYRSRRIPLLSARVRRSLPQKVTCNPRRLRVIKLHHPPPLSLSKKKTPHHRCLAHPTTSRCPSLAIASKVIMWHRSAASFSTCVIEYRRPLSTGSNLHDSLAKPEINPV